MLEPQSADKEWIEWDRFDGIRQFIARGGKIDCKPSSWWKNQTKQGNPAPNGNLMGNDRLQKPTN